MNESQIWKLAGVAFVSGIVIGAAIIIGILNLNGVGA